MKAIRSLGCRAFIGLRVGLRVGLCVGLFAAPLSALAAELPEFRLAIEQHRFTPAVLEVPAGKKLRLVIENRDATPEEFESYDLNREKIVAGKASIVVFIGPLKAGNYEYFGEFNAHSARGRIVAK